MGYRFTRLRACLGGKNWGRGKIRGKATAVRYRRKKPFSVEKLEYLPTTREGSGEKTQNAVLEKNGQGRPVGGVASGARREIRGLIRSQVELGGVCNHIRLVKKNHSAAEEGGKKKQRKVAGDCLSGGFGKKGGNQGKIQAPAKV